MSNLVTIKISVDIVRWQDTKESTNNWDSFSKVFNNWTAIYNYIP